MNETKERILRYLSYSDWKTYFCWDKKGRITEYCFEESFIVKISHSFPSGNFYSKEQCDELLKEFIREYIDEIVLWLDTKKGPMLKHISFGRNIGYVWDCTGDEPSRTETDRVFVYLQKDYSLTSSGFYVSDFCPELK